ncbi:metal ABC transporter solute-binding protein, Zn/Mn family [Arthrobacter sp.]|uniref:metal ABC transporter solute-binding protein, Zn/Mn family n=1 Tax=Arthrobacter sp. TaxID=1667 RepID=UPI003A8D8159
MRSRFAVIPALLISLGMAGCSGSTPAAEDNTVTVVASTSAYGDIVRQVGGDAVTVESIISKASQDPHSYEATPQDKLTLSHADLVVENGGGYDAFVDTLTQDLGTKKADIITAVDYSKAAHADGESADGDDSHGSDAGHEGHDHASFNEHVWYDLPTAAAVAQEIAHRLGELKPEDASTFTANAKKFAQGTADLDKRLHSLGADAAGHEFAMTEPVPFYLLEAAGLSDGTPEGFSSAIEEGNDVSPLMLRDLENKLASGDISLLAYNAQTSSPQTEAVRGLAEKSGVPVVDFTETLPEGSSYLQWMGSNIDAIQAALKG